MHTSNDAYMNIHKYICIYLYTYSRRESWARLAATVAKFRRPHRNILRGDGVHLWIDMCVFYILYRHVYFLYS